jgi:TPP-dependent pyruvate/acetoin dehydrogenase alpha subunit
VSFFGDGAVNEGIFHETLNMAALWKLPVVYVCENNQYALSMTVSESSAVPNLAERARAYNIPGVQVDGNDVVAVYLAAQNAVARARNGQGPTLLECITYRVRGHARFEAAGYRQASEVEAWQALDPILRLRQSLLENELASQAELDGMQTEVEAEIQAAIATAEAGEDVQAEDFLQYISDEGSNA